MLAFRDATEDVHEPRSVRLEQRTKPRVKATIERAAACVGVGTSEFITSAAYREAISTLDAERRTVLDEAASRRFFSALSDVSANSTMRDLMKDYEENVGNAVK